MKHCLNKFIRKIYYKKFGNVGIESLIPIKDSKNISGKKNIFVGDYCSIGPGCYISANNNGKLIIKNGSILAPNVTILTRSHNYNINISKIPFDENYTTADVIIDEAVWIGQNAIILPGVHIGKGAVIGAGGVIARSVPEYAICVGNPARIVGYRDNVTFDKLLYEEAYVNRFRCGKQYIKVKEKASMTI